MANKYLDLTGLQDFATKLSTKLHTIFATKADVGAPLVASTVAEMTDEDRIYVYTGSETGYTSGNWYYWDGEAWTSGGTYNSQGIGDGEVTTEKIANGAVTEQKLSGELASVIRNLGDDLYNLYPNDIAEGEIASFPDGADDIPVKSMKVNVEPYQNLNGYNYPWVGGAGKNLLKITATTQTINGVTFTVNADGTVTANGTANAEANMVLTAGTGIFDFNNDTILNGSVGGFGSNVRIRFGVSNPADSYDDFGNGVTIPRIADISSRYAYVQITIASGTTVNNITFRPMIRLATETDPTFAPYENICPIYPANGRNLIPNTASTQTINGVTFTVNDDGTVSLSGTASAFTIFEVGTVHLDVGQYVLTGNPLGSASTVYVRIKDESTQIVYSADMDKEFSIITAQEYHAQIAVQSGINVSGRVIRVMARPVEIADPTYVPYRAFGMIMTNKNLIELDSVMGGFIEHKGTIHAQGESVEYTSGLIPLVGNTITAGYFKYASGESPWTAISYYGKDGHFIWRMTSNTDATYTLTTPDYVPNAGYVRISVRTYGHGIDGMYCAYGEDVEFEAPVHGRYFSRDYNMWDEEWEVGSIDSTTGQNTNADDRLRSKNYMPVEEGKTYYFANDGTSVTGYFFVRQYDSSKAYISGTSVNQNTTYTVPSGVAFIRWTAVAVNAGTYSGGVQINYSNPSQVGYGGVLDVETGLLTVTKGYVDLGSLTWERNTTSGEGDLYRFVASLANSKPNLDNNTVPNIKCSQYKADTPANVYLRIVSATILSGTGKVAVYDTRYATYMASDFKTAMNGVQFVYELATPVQYQLTPTQVKTLLGYNNIWTDSGTVEVNYRADTTKYIQKLIGSTEDDMIANANIPANQYFMVGMELFYSTQAIAVGETIAVGINCNRTTLAEALNALNS